MRSTDLSQSFSDPLLGKGFNKDLTNVQRYVRLFSVAKATQQKEGNMKAKMLKASKNIQGGVFYELDTPIEHDGKKYEVICTWSAKRHTSMILTFPARSGVLAVVRQDGKFVTEGDVLSVDGYVKSEDLLKRIGYSLS